MSHPDARDRLPAQGVLPEHRSNLCVTMSRVPRNRPVPHNYACDVLIQMTSKPTGSTCSVRHNRCCRVLHNDTRLHLCRVNNDCYIPSPSM